MNAPVTVDVKDKVSTIKINRPEVKNALNLETVRLLTSHIEAAGADRSSRCLLITGEGKEAFCSGADLKELAARRTLNEKNEFFDALIILINAMRQCQKPIICKVHGFALAGGLSLIAAADIVLASEDAKFSLPELKVGMIPGVVMIALEPLLGRRALSYLCLSADMIDAHKALEIGLVTELHKKTALDAQTADLARKISSYSREALQATKNMLNKDPSWDKRISLRSREMALYTLSADCQEGITAFQEKRKPRWD